MEKKRETKVSEHVAARVKELRRARGWSMRGLSEELADIGYDMSPAVINVLENGVAPQHGYPARRRSVSVDELLVLADVFRVRVSELLP